jgi:hypothetical protein
MNKLITSTAVPTRELKLEAIANISASFELLCLASGMEALKPRASASRPCRAPSSFQRNHELQAF